jgi:hypothetical protein
MATDVLMLGGIAFTGYSTPDVMTGGGQQAMVVHKLPGGSRVIDTLGPDEMQAAWRGHFFENAAYAKCLALDAMRASGAVYQLVWGGQFKPVIIQDFVYRVRRLPVWVEYAVVCTVVTNPMFGNLGANAIPSSASNLISGDLNSSAADAVLPGGAPLGQGGIGSA